MQLGIKQRRRFRDIEWLMPSVDVVDVLERLGVDHITPLGEQVEAMCPDHHLFVGREPSHPKWTCNVDTGLTYCFTEPRGSNLFWTVLRLLDCTPDEAVEFMTGSKVADLHAASIRGRIGRLRRKKQQEKVRDPVRLDDIRDGLQNRYISEACYAYFTHPSEKKPTNITASTVDRYRVFERRWGYYANRAIIPFFSGDELVGFCAIDLLGKKRWLLEHPLKDEEEYRKVLYPLHFRAGEYLFGYDDVCERPDYVIVTEGAREVMKLWQEGFMAVGCLKADLSDEQVLALSKRAPRELILMFDGDEAGWSATDKNAAKLSDVFRVRKCYLPVGLDPKNLNGSEIENLRKRAKLAGQRH